MSGCDPVITLTVKCADPACVIEASHTFDCDHGEDDPCEPCEPPTEEEA